MMLMCLTCVFYMVLLIFKAHLNNDEKWAYEDIYLARKNNFKITKVLGSEFNIKITKPEDLQIAERYLK